MKMRKLFFFCFLLGITNCLTAQDNGVGSTSLDTSFTKNDDYLKVEEQGGFAKDVQGDTTVNFNGLSISKDTIAAFKLKKEYRWASNIDSFLVAQKKEAEQQTKIVVRETNGDSFLGKLFNSGILQFLMWLMAASLLLFIVYKLFLSEGLFKKRSAKQKLTVLEPEEDLSLNNDYEKLLRKAYVEANWKFAMRFLFLKTLQKLNDNEFIKYAVDKTNSAYVLELPVTKKNDFASLALYYEYVWYGNVAIEKNIFDSIEIKFNNFLNKI